MVAAELKGTEHEQHQSDTPQAPQRYEVLSVAQEIAFESLVVGVADEIEGWTVVVESGEKAVKVGCNGGAAEYGARRSAGSPEDQGSEG